ncbi:MAG: LacI family transcriptional regulator, partial [Candidatus Accumulibacter sp.]|nr:LacI family transcriptional regulator [Accumulibacter sp.]
EATLKKIQTAIAELNYRPSNAARQLKTGHVPVFGLLVPSITNPMFASLAREIEIVAKKEYGYRLLLGNTYREKSEEVIFLDDLLSHGVRGVIVASSLADQSHFQDAIDRGLTIVNYDCRSIEHNKQRISADNISMNNYEAGKIVTRFLTDSGCRNLAFATASGKTTSRRDKIDGFLAAAEEAGLAKNVRIIEGKAESEYGDSELTELGLELARKIAAIDDQRPDGVVAINDMLAIGLLAGFRKCGISVPNDISLVGIDDMILSALVSPALTTVRPPVQEMATLVVSRLMARLKDPSIPVEDFLFTPTLVNRESVRVRDKMSAGL